MLVCHDGRWKTVTMVSAISNQGLLRFKVQDKSMDQLSFIEFLQSMIEDEAKKIFLITAGAGKEDQGNGEEARHR